MGSARRNIVGDMYLTVTLLLCYDCCGYDQAAYSNMYIIMWLRQGVLKLCALNSSKRGGGGGLLSQNATYV